MFNEKFDVIIFDNVGMPYTGSTFRMGALGGSEFETVLLAEGLAASGYKVAILNSFRFATLENKVYYLPVDSLNNHVMKCKTLLVMRSSPVPQGRIEFDELLFWFTDLPNENHLSNISNFIAPGRPATGICVSEWHKSIQPQGWNFAAIPNMIPDWVYELKPMQKNKNKYIYASAAMKGLPQTIEVWREFRKNYFMKKAELFVASPGYDQPDLEQLKSNKIQFLGNLPFDVLVKELQSSQYMFYVNNNFPETFCIVAVLAEILGVVPQILTMGHPGALPEVLSNNQFVTNHLDKFQNFVFENAKTVPELKPAKDYRVSTILPKWIKALKL